MRQFSLSAYAYTVLCVCMCVVVGFCVLLNNKENGKITLVVCDYILLTYSNKDNLLYGIVAPFYCNCLLPFQRMHYTNCLHCCSFVYYFLVLFKI